MRFRLSLLLLFSTMAVGCGQSASDGATIITAGVGRVNLTPTKARLYVDVSTQGLTASDAATQNDKRVQQVMTVLRADSSIDSMRVTEVDVSPNQNDAGKVVAFEASATIEVVIRRLDRIGQVMDGALRGGATSIGRVAFETDSTAAGRRQALAKAFASARADAEALARATEQQLGRLLSVSAGDGLPFGSNAFQEASVTTGASSAEFGNAQSGIISISPTPEDVVVVASVNAKWLLQSR